MNSQTGNTMGSNGGGNGNRNGSRARRLFRRGPWENASAIVIGLGIVMLMQPFALELYTYSFDVILVGTVGFLITSHFRE